VGVLGIASYLVFVAKLLPSSPAGYFWPEWEFLAAASAAAYNFLVYPLFYFTARRSVDSLLRGDRKMWVNLFRFVIPTAFLSLVCFLVWLDVQIDGPAPSEHIRLKLWLTFFVFASFMWGDILIFTGLEETSRGYERARETAWHIKFFDTPFVISYLVLIRIYSTHTTTDVERELYLQAFLGGASALEMLVQSTMHALDLPD
jgi:hypothetical protein